MDAAVFHPGQQGAVEYSFTTFKTKSPAISKGLALSVTSTPRARAKSPRLPSPTSSPRLPSPTSKYSPNPSARMSPCSSEAILSSLLAAAEAATTDGNELTVSADYNGVAPHQHDKTKQEASDKAECTDAKAYDEAPEGRMVIVFDRMIAALEQRVKGRLGDIEQRVEQRFAELEGRVGTQESALIEVVGSMQKLIVDIDERFKRRQLASESVGQVREQDMWGNSTVLPKQDEEWLDIEMNTVRSLQKEIQVLQTEIRTDAGEVSRLNARVDLLESDITAMNDRDKQAVELQTDEHVWDAQPVFSFSAETSNSAELATISSAPSAQLARRMTRLEADQRSLDESMWYIRDIVGALDFRMEQKFPIMRTTIAENGLTDEASHNTLRVQWTTESGPHLVDASGFT